MKLNPPTPWGHQACGNLVSLLLSSPLARPQLPVAPWRFRGNASAALLEARLCVAFPTPQKKASDMLLGVQSAPKCAPKASQIEPRAPIFITSFVKSRLCIRLHIYYVLD